MGTLRCSDICSDVTTSSKPWIICKPFEDGLSLNSDSINEQWLKKEDNLYYNPNIYATHIMLDHNIEQQYHIS